MAQTVFNRYEKKYIMPEEIYEELRYRLKPYMEEDKYGLHTICNIYYDTPDALLIRRSIEKPKYKEKLRLRSYGIPNLESKVFLEIKKKYRKVVNKRRIELTLQEAYDYVERGIHPNMEGQIVNEIDFFLKRYPLEKSLYLAYDRIALFGKEDSQFRITFDKIFAAEENLWDWKMVIRGNCSCRKDTILWKVKLWEQHLYGLRRFYQSWIFIRPLFLNMEIFIKKRWESFTLKK